MDISYHRLIEDHEKIVDAAGHLPSCIADKSYEAEELAAKLDMLAGQVRDHLAVEDAIMVRDHGKMMRPWAETCQDGPNGVARLRKDWLAFLDAWNRRTISENRRGFAEAADHLLGRLRERIQTETWAFYATGLQSGAISLR
ncbi:hypothetical protein [Sphingomonas lacusdianchii]|uniref:hypothetical protein n=1 Tax=Sphingomonas lacusdianchii TaxID=2917992 RepID=UPI001F5A7A25|nr:hypothetical protein [Sphingomonas sp. JXJ CY 53]